MWHQRFKYNHNKETKVEKKPFAKKESYYINVKFFAKKEYKVSLEAFSIPELNVKRKETKDDAD